MHIYWMNLRFSIYLLIVLSDLQIAPIIHEWTYDAMCHDLLNMDGNKYVYEVQFCSCCSLAAVIFFDPRDGDRLLSTRIFDV